MAEKRRNIQIYKEIVRLGMLQKKQWIYLTMLQIELQALTLMSSVPSFKASTGWMQKFMKRHGLVLLQKTK